MESNEKQKNNQCSPREVAAERLAEIFIKQIEDEKLKRDYTKKHETK
ncbi:MAG: hypothetical protein PHD31_00140 [Candidatus Pacebacteria bacterium]|nr:hypothetical protein [Candidatus Paceibacterota bacterium]